MKDCPLCHGYVLAVSSSWVAGTPSTVEIDHHAIKGVRPAQHVLTATNAAERRNLLGFRVDLMTSLLSGR